MGLEKYTQYLTIKHNWDKYNCLTLIELLYKDFLNINFTSIWKRQGRLDGNFNVGRKWFLKYTKEHIDKETKYWDEINLVDLQEFDILIFITKKGRIFHFAMYVGENKFINIQENSYCTLIEFNEYWRKLFYKGYRYVV